MGDVRPGETRPRGIEWSWQQALGEATRATAQVVAVETCYMERPDRVDQRALRPTDAGPQIMISWGHPYGLEYGRNAQAEEEVLAWLSVAAKCGHTIMRVVVAHPHLRSPDANWEQVGASLGAIRRITAAAERASITLAIENHADVTAEQLLWIINEVSSERLRVCFDTVNAVRVGDDLQRAAEALAPYAVACHAKDIDSQPWHPLSGPTSTPLGDGVLPVEEAVRLIARASPECRFLVELAHLGPGDVDEQALIVEDLGWLRSTLHRED